MDYKNCIICGNKESSSVYIESNSFLIIHCSKCGLYYQELMDKAISLNNVYNNIYTEDPRVIKNKSYWKHRMNTHYKDIEEYHKNSGRLLDIGCSYGFLMDYFASKGWATTGIDISENAIKYAKSKGLDVHNAAIEGFNPKNKFDLIVMSNVLEHLEDPLKALSIVKNWLSDKGIIYVRVPNVESVILFPKRQSFLGDLKPFEHFFYFSKDTLKNLFNKCGLKYNIKTDGRVDLGNFLNCFFRSKFVLKNKWQNLNFNTVNNDKKNYIFLRFIYGEVLSFLGKIPLGPNNRELVAILSH